MKHLYLLRHAKSSWKEPQLEDIDRPLNARGKRACATMAPHILGVDFHHVYCSPAQRARSTIEGLVATQSPGEIVWQIEDALYTFDADDILQFCHELDDHTASAVIVGHNPALTDLCNDLTRAGIDNIPTCGYVAMQLTVEHWCDLDSGCGTLQEFLYPKLYKDA
ncbi:MAG: SixA phosphatase family protein [Pseudomonadales bacterium]